MSYESGCAGKVKYKKYIAAEYVLHNEHSSTDAVIYKCKYCGTFHIGSPDSKNKKIIKSNGKRNKGPEVGGHKRKHRRFKF